MHNSTLMLNGEDVVQSHHIAPGNGANSANDNPTCATHPTPGVRVSFTSSVVSSLTPAAVELLGTSAVSDSVACVRANAAAAVWQTLLHKHPVAVGLRTIDTVPGGPSACVPVMGRPLSTLAILWNSLPPQQGPGMEAVLASVPGIELTGRWRVVASEATIRNAAGHGNMPHFAADTMAALNGGVLSGVLFSRWLHGLGWAHPDAQPVESEPHFGDEFIAQMLGRVEYLDSSDAGTATGAARGAVHAHDDDSSSGDTEVEVEVGGADDTLDDDDGADTANSADGGVSSDANVRYLTTVDLSLPNGTSATVTLAQLAGTGPFVAVALHEAHPVFTATPDFRLASARLRELAQMTTAMASQQYVGCSLYAFVSVVHTARTRRRANPHPRTLVARLCTTVTVWDEPKPPCGLIRAFFPWVPSCDVPVRPITLAEHDIAARRTHAVSETEGPAVQPIPHRDLIMLNKFAVGAEPGWYASAIAEVRALPKGAACVHGAQSQTPPSPVSAWVSSQTLRRTRTQWPPHIHSRVASTAKVHAVALCFVWLSVWR